MRILNQNSISHRNISFSGINSTFYSLYTPFSGHKINGITCHYTISNQSALNLTLSLDNMIVDVPNRNCDIFSYLAATSGITTNANNELRWNPAHSASTARYGHIFVLNSAFTAGSCDMNVDLIGISQ